MNYWRLALLSVAGIVLIGTVDERSAVLQPTVLVPSTMRDAAVPAFVSETHPKCDRDGNMYFHLFNSRGSLANILRLSPDGNQGQLFDLPKEYAEKGQIEFNDFSVTPNGLVYMFAGVGPKAYVFRFDLDGTFDTAIPVDVAGGLLVTSIIGFDSGAALLFGYSGTVGPAGADRKSYLGEIDVAGNLIPVPSPLPKLAGKPGGLVAVGATSGEDGNAYLLGGDEIWAISQEGETVRQVHFKRPNAGDSATNVRVSGDWAVIDLASQAPALHENSDGSKQPGRITFQYLVINVLDGQTIGLYELPAELSGLDEVCFSRKEGLKFMHREKGRIKFFTAHL